MSMLGKTVISISAKIAIDMYGYSREDCYKHV